MAQTSDYYGSIVAFEGTRDTVSTQLRLLPSSPKILVLPPLQHFIQEGDPDEPFDARTYVLKVHDACSARNKLALSFLQNSSPDDKKLAFMNGGTASAQAMCITAISQHMDEPCIPSAKNTFATLARGGVARLRNPSATPEGHCRHHSSATSHSSATQEEPDHVRRMSEAMRAADALDRETASLQPDNDMDLTNLSRSRSLSAPLRRLFDDLEGDTPFYLIGASQDRDEAIPVLGVSQKAPSNVHGLSVGKARGSRLSRANRSSDDIKWEHSTNQWSSGCAGELGLPPSPRSTSTFGSVLSPETTTFGSLPNAPIVTYGEARLIDVRWSPKRIPSRQPRRIRSVDRVYASTIETRNISGGDSNEPLASRFPYDLPSPTKLPLRSRFNEASAQATFVESNRGRTRQQPPTLLDLSNQIKSRRRHMYVDKGTGPAQSYLDDRHLGRHRRLDHGVDTNDLSTAKPTASPFDADAPFEVVLPLHEDLVIHLNDTKHNTLLGSIIQDFKRRVLPLTAAPVTEVLESHSDTLQGHMSRYEAQAQRETCSPPAAIATPDCSVDEEYDPPASHDACLQPQIPWSQQDGGRRRQPFTPARTPSPVMAVPEKSFHEFQTTGCSTVVGVQNSLRSVLNIYFSADEPGYQQYPLLPELSRMWKPVFRQTDGYGDKQHERELDLILAVGGQKGVSRDFISSLTGSLGNLGVRANGMTRSNRLDLRYLIANSMQSYTSQPLAKQTQDNPFTNPLFLATLIIPHLETYLAAHNETRFLILEYPPEHLSTVLALQRLVGNDILKVAGVLAAESSNPTSISKTCLPTGKGLHTTNPSISSVTSTRTNATLVSPKLGSKPMETPSFSKANFLLTSAATDSEIAALISTIWKILIDISHFYIPEGAPKESNKGREYILAQKDNPFSNSLTAISGEYAPFATAKLMMGFQVPAAPPEAKEPSTTDTKFRHQLTRSSASIKSSKTANGTYSTRRRLQKLLAQETGGDSDRCSVRPPATHSLYRDMSEEEEDRLCQDERRYMPLYDGKPGSRKGNSRKALAFLGLA